MTDNINKLAQSLDGTKQQQTAASIVNLTDDDVVKIWDYVSNFIESYMKQAKGIAIPGFGTFSFIHKRIDVGNNKYLLIQRPVFVLSEKVAQTHGLKFTKYPVNGSIPVHPLNYFYIQTQSTYARDQIEQCVKHVLQIFHRSIAAQRNVEFTFSRIGKLQIRNGKVKMKFFKHFIQSVDENASTQVIENMCNRPYTCDSVMSERDAARPVTASNVVLPRINSRVGISSMQAIQEENQAEENEQNLSNSESSERIKSDTNGSYFNSDGFKLPPLIESSGEPAVSSTKTPPSSNVIKTTGTGIPIEGVIPVASLFSSADMTQPPAVVKRSSTSSMPTRRPVSLNPIEQDNQQATSNLPTNQTVIQPPADNVSSSTLSRSRSERISARDRLSSSLNIYPQQYREILPKSMTSCDIHDSNRELCRVCHERAKKNIPVYLHEEKRIREGEDTRLLEEYQHQRELEEHSKREAAMKAAREEKLRVAAFNLGVAQAIRAKNLQRPQTTDIPRSIIFQRRIRTPPSILRERDLGKHLEAQIKAKEEQQNSQKVDKEFAERLEQIQLAESLAQERENYLKNKRQRQEQLKNALEDQMRNKTNSIPSSEQETPYFGLNDMTTDKLKERRFHAIEIVRQQKDLIEQRQRQLLLKQIQDQENEVKALNAMREDLLADNLERHQRDSRIRKDLETHWTQAKTDKKKRDQEEKTHLKAPDGGLIHEQCDQYKRCTQCQRNMNNIGKSNLWKDTRYIPGARVMV